MHELKQYWQRLQVRYVVGDSSSILRVSHIVLQRFF